MCGRCGCVRRGRGAGVRPALIEGIVEPGLLLLLGERESYGYELASELEQRNLVPQRVQAARVYEVLRRLEADGAVSSRQEASQSGPARRRYTITRRGRERMDRWAEALRLTERTLSTLLDTYEGERRR
jgi:PadR family transcriptional regulator PadR